MGLVASDSGGSNFTPAPAGTHLAICCQVIDLGHQFSQFYGKTKHKVLIGWELPDEKNEEGKPFLVWNRYTLSLHENSQLTVHLEAWRGRPFTEEERKGFHLKNVLGKPCMLNIAHEPGSDGKGKYARVKAVMAIPKGTKVPDLTAEQVLFDIEEWDSSVFDGFSDNLKKTIENSEERKKAGSQQKAAQMVAAGAGMESAPGMDDSDIPFAPQPAIYSI
jgi:hypothetical protein